eukprot:Skav223942  [mRNA]  locus=scaffold1465:375432:377064:+ [translate_table: standard]
MAGEVVLLDVDQKNLERGLKASDETDLTSFEQTDVTCHHSPAQRSIKIAQVDEILQQIRGVSSYDELSDCDIVVEVPLLVPRGW